MKILRILSVLVLTFIIAGCDVLNDEGKDTMMKSNEREVELNDLINITDWSDQLSWRTLVGEWDEITGLNSNVTTEVYKLTDGGVLKVEISYAMSGRIFSYVVYDDILILFFDDLKHAQVIYEKEECNKCIYLNDITDIID